MLEWINKQTTKQSHNIQEELMHGHVLILMHVYPSSPTQHLHLGWYPWRIRYLSSDSQTLRWSLLNKRWWCLSSSSHHQYHNQLLTLLIAWGSPCHSLSSWPLKTGILQCLKLVAIRSSVSSDSTMMAKVLSLWSPLWLRKRFSFSLGFSH